MPALAAPKCGLVDVVPGGFGVVPRLLDVLEGPPFVAARFDVSRPTSWARLAQNSCPGVAAVVAAELDELASAYCALEFTVAELRHVYELVWGVELDPRNVHRNATSTAGFLQPTGKTTTRGGGHPAELYRRGHTTLLHPPLLRTSDEMLDP